MSDTCESLPNETADNSQPKLNFTLDELIYFINRQSTIDTRPPCDITTDEYAKAQGVSIETARKQLVVMVDLGLAEKVSLRIMGHRRNIYRPTATAVAAKEAIAKR